MRDALNATGRPILFSLCGWHDWYSPVGAALGNSWRISGDVNKWPSVYASAMINAELSANAGPGAWNDPVRVLARARAAHMRSCARRRVGPGARATEGKQARRQRKTDSLA